MLVLVIGAHWIVLQSVAWVGMVVAYSQRSSLTEALAKTFDGQHPCCLCKLVKEGKESEQKQDSSKLVVKIDFFLEKHASTLTSTARYPQPAAPERQLRVRSDRPPTPPPRLA